MKDGGATSSDNSVTTAYTGLSEYNERLNSNIKLYLGGSRNTPSGDYEIFNGYIYQPRFYVNFSTLNNLDYVIGGEKQTIFYFNVNGESDSYIYD